MKIKHLLFAILLAFTTQLFAQVNNEKAYIVVTGSAEMEIVPDEIFICIMIKEKYVNREKISNYPALGTLTKLTIA